MTKKLRTDGRTAFQLYIVDATKKCDIWLRPRPKVFATNNVRSITYKFQKVRSFTLDVQQFEHN